MYKINLITVVIVIGLKMQVASFNLLKKIAIDARLVIGYSYIQIIASVEHASSILLKMILKAVALYRMMNTE